MAFLEYWGLKERPFDENRNPRYFYESTDHLEALERLLYIINDGALHMGLLTGEIGSGKTITRTVLNHSLFDDNCAVVSLENSNFPFEDILFDILTKITFKNSDFGESMEVLYDLRGDIYGLMKLYTKVVEHLYETEGRQLVIILDEAQQMKDKDLDQVKNLLNVAAEENNYATIILVGQPELRQKVKNLKQVDQRISLRFHLNNLDAKNCSKYVTYRLKVAGHTTGNIFTNHALHILYIATDGVPREINRTCKLAMEYALAQKKDIIDRAMLEIIIEDLKLQKEC